MRKLAERRPVVFAVLAAAGAMVLTIPFAVLARALGAGTELTALIAVAIESVYALGLVWRLGWWRRVGVVGPTKRTGLLAFPMLLALIPILLYGSIETPREFIATYSLILLLTGVGEEILNRGVILNALLPIGIFAAIGLQRCCSRRVMPLSCSRVCRRKMFS